MKTDSVRSKPQSLGDAAIDGLIAGLLAGVVMLVVIILGVLFGEAPAAVLERFTTEQAITPAAGVLAHLAVSGIYGVGFSLLVYLLPSQLFNRLPGWLVGLAYGAGLLLLAQGIILNGLASPLAELPGWLLALGHGVYGLVLGLRVLPQPQRAQN